MEPFEIQKLLQYNRWANQAILSAAHKIDPTLLIYPIPCSFGSLRGTLVHVYGAEVVWRMRCAQGISPTSLPVEQDFTNLASLVQVWEEEMRAMLHYATSLDLNLPVTVRYTNTRGVPMENPLWQIVAHLVNHGTQFRSEAALLLSNWGSSPGDVDMIAFFRKEAQT